MSAVLFAVALFVWLEMRGPPRWRVPRAVAIAAMARRRLVDLGRTSLSVFVFHIFVFKQLSRTLGLYKRLDAAPALAAALAIIVAFAAFSWWWGRHGYAYGAEWLVRRLDGVVRVR
jgi:uncharacterized membrane protein YeiB